MNTHLIIGIIIGTVASIITYKYFVKKNEDKDKGGE